MFKIFKKQYYKGLKKIKKFKVHDNIEFVLIKPKSRVLDIGCSPGSWVQVSLKLRAESVTGIDLDEVNVEDVIKVLEKSKIKYIKKDFWIHFQKSQI